MFGTSEVYAGLLGNVSPLWAWVKTLPKGKVGSKTESEGLIIHASKQLIERP
ncbi:hypothetical protein [Holospora curviuscula]|uniref:Uncharacterized protein n=1 Tax=Holospora curviuscula TaxID=1082868 RepID=A0A2S5RAP4_9PROT|nr:hypothetical protein [Holospora curviuscula]PPE04262.1 hypothetical protein HCUR_00453 [Holospora curviuscula]